MNVFILCTGRCGSTTFIKACNHINNYTSAHESRTGLLREDRLNYQNNHIEADNRLSWFLGKLNMKYGNNAFYVHLKRDEIDTAISFSKRHHLSNGIISAYSNAILLNRPNDLPLMDMCIDYVQTVNSNIEDFLKDKTNKMSFSLENAKEDFIRFWNMIYAEGDMKSAIKEWELKYNQ